MPQGKGAVSGIFQHLHSIGLNGQNDIFITQKYIRPIREKFSVFLYRQDIVGVYVALALMLGFLQNLQQDLTGDTK